MVGEIDGIGDVVTGSMAASAVSRGAAGSARHSSDDDIEHGLCLNCGTRLTGEYCHGCGQSAHIHRSIGAFFHDLLHGVLHFEGKTWRTLPLLAWRPGELTRRYINGERARFVSPMALFLFSVFLLFGVASLADSDPDLANAGPDIEQTMVREIQTLNADIARLETDIASGRLDSRALAATRRELAEAEQEQIGLMSGYRALTGRTGIASGAPGTRDDQVSDFLRGLDDGDRGSAGADAAGSQNPTVRTSIDGDRNVNDSWLGRQFVAGVEKARANPALVFYKIKTNAYKFGWALIPLSVPFVWLIMVGRRMRQRHFYDHVVFTTYSIAFMMLLLVVLIVAAMAGAPAALLVLVAGLYPPFHMYRQLKGAYRLSRANALVRAAVLVMCSLFAFSVFVFLLVTAGLVG